MKPEEYWSKRMEALNEAELRKGEEYVRKQNEEYDKAMARIKRDTDAWYARMAKNNDVSMAEARKLLKDNELQEFRWSVQDYIKAGRENAIDQRWMKELENASAKVHITRLEELQTKLQQEAELLAAKRVKGATETLGDIYKDGYYRGIHEVQRGVGKGVPFARLDGRQIDKVLSKPWAPDGSNFSARIWADRDKLVSELHTTLTQNLINGSPSDKVINDFAQRMGVSKSIAERLILTESAYFAGQSRLDGYKQTGITHYKYVATLDSRTSDKCRHMDSKVIPISEAEPGVNYPPLHAYCRSTTIPHFDEAEPDSDDDEDLYDVPEDMPYKDWAEEHAPADATDPPKPADTAPVGPPKVTTVEPDKLTIDEEAAVTNYIGGGSYTLNDKLRRSQPLNSEEMAWVEQLDKALNKLPRYSGDLTRSVHFFSPAALQDFVRDIKPETVVQYPQYISTTAGDLYNSKAQVIFYILDAALGADITALNPGEMEVLYGRDFPFKVVELEIINGMYHILLRELTK
ncbi:minor capsid protein [Paenibacillus sp. GCM10012307]|uniref:Minor capsid protein n=1 Tax=Paenibacillus roseus TaxID=2798579 RepID=A0A934J4W3_9BACL|nr:minor capsid protein [Paenibacillus roseus]MBJ6360861.1 minor capsid protein [Paenibacillus roseus]